MNPVASTTDNHPGGTSGIAGLARSCHPHSSFAASQQQRRRNVTQENPSHFWLDRPVLVTGGSGLLGGFLVEHLLGAGAAVVCLIRDWNPDSIVLDRYRDEVTFARGDIVDQLTVERVLGEYEIDTVFHLAAQTLVPVANRNPVSTFESNIKGTWSVLEAARRSPMVRQIVAASSDKAYGAQTELPYTEELPLQGRHPYDVSKSCADLICRSYAET